MNLKELLGNSKLTPEEVDANLEYRSLKNSIHDAASNYSQDILETVSRLVRNIAEGKISTLCGGYNCNDESVISDEEKKLMLKLVYKNAKKSLDNFENKVKDIVETSGNDHTDEKSDNEEEKSETEKNVVEIPISTQIPAANLMSTMFGY